MIKSKKIAVLAIIAMVLTMLPMSIFGATMDSERLAGSDRLGTGLEISSLWDKADNVVLAAADQANLVDSLAAASLAGQLDAPILLTFKNSLDSAVKDRIIALGAKNVYVVGAVADAVVDQVKAIDGVMVEKLAGASRWATADAINAKLTDVKGTFVVGYNAIADALSVASYAAANGYQIVLADAEGNVDSGKLKGTVYIIGGTGVVKDIDDAVRFGGTDRYATNARVIEGLDFSFDRIYVANGLSLVDALAAAPLAAKTKSPVFLTNGSSIPALSNAAIAEKVNDMTKVVALGGTGAVPDGVVGEDMESEDGVIVVNSVEGVEGTYNVREKGQYLGIKINGSRTVTQAQLDAAGYDVVFTTTEGVFKDDAEESDTGELNDKAMQKVLLDDEEDTFEYWIEVYQRSEVIAESDYVECTLIDGKITAANSITSYRLDLVDGSTTLAEKMTSNIMIVGETFEVKSVKAATIAGGTGVDITSSVKLDSSDEWVIGVDERQFTANTAGKATITIKSGTVTQSFTITVKDDDADNGRVATKATADSSSVKVAQGTDCYDFVTVTFVDQYGDPFANADEVYFNRDGDDITSNVSITDGDNVIATVESNERSSSNDNIGMTTKGKAIFTITGDAARGKGEITFFGDRYYGAGTSSLKQIGKISVETGSKGSVDLSKAKYVAADSDSAEYTLDRNVFKGASQKINMYLMKYTRNGYALGAFTETDLAKDDAITVSRDDLIYNGNYDTIVANYFGEKGKITIVWDGESGWKTGTTQLQIKVVDDPSATQPKTKTVNRSIKVVNTIPLITKVTFEDVGDFNVDEEFTLDEILDINNIVTDGTLGDGELRGRVRGGIVEFYFQEFADDTAPGKQQVVGYLTVPNTNISKFVTFVDAPKAQDIKIIFNFEAGKKETVQFGVQRAGSSGNIATLKVDVR